MKIIVLEDHERIRDNFTLKATQNISFLIANAIDKYLIKEEVIPMW